MHGHLNVNRRFHTKHKNAYKAAYYKAAYYKAAYYKAAYYKAAYYKAAYYKAAYYKGPKHTNGIGLSGLTSQTQQFEHAGYIN